MLKLFGMGHTQISRGKLKIVYGLHCWRLLRAAAMKMTSKFVQWKAMGIKKRRRICKELKGKQTQRQSEKQADKQTNKKNTHTHYQDKWLNVSSRRGCAAPPVHNMKNARGKIRMERVVPKKSGKAPRVAGREELREVMLKKGFGLWPHFL